MLLETFGILMLSLQLFGSYASHVSSYSNIEPLSLNKFPTIKGTQTYVTPITVNKSPYKFNIIDKSDVHSYTQNSGYGQNKAHAIGSAGTTTKAYPYTTVSPYFEKTTPSTTTVAQSLSRGKFRDFGFTSSESATISPGTLTTVAEVVTKPNFVIEPVIETVQKPTFVVQDNIIGTIQKPEFVIQEIPEVVTKPEFVIEQEVIDTVIKPTFVIEEQVNIVQKPEFEIQENVEFIVKPDFLIQEITEIIPKPTFVVEENIVPVQKPTYNIQSSQEIIQKPDIVVSTVPVTVTKPDYQITESIIPVSKPTYFIQETQETVIRPEFYVTEQVIPVPKPNYVIQDQVQIVERPNYQVLDVVETVQRPQYTVQDSTVAVERPEFYIEEVTETVVKPTFVEQAVAETVISPYYVIEDEAVSVTRPQFVVEETVVPVVKPEFYIEDVFEVVPKPEYVVEDVPIAVEKPSYVLIDTPIVVPKPNYMIQEIVETISKPSYNIEERVEVVKKPEFVIQDTVVARIQKPKFIVVSPSHPEGEVFEPEKYKESHVSDSETTFIEIHPLKNIPTTRTHTYQIPQAEPFDHGFQSTTVVIPPTLKPQVTLGIEEYTVKSFPEIKSSSIEHAQQIRITELSDQHNSELVIPPSLKPIIVKGLEEEHYTPTPEPLTKSIIKVSHPLPTSEFATPEPVPILNHASVADFLDSTPTTGNNYHTPIYQTLSKIIAEQDISTVEKEDYPSSSNIHTIILPSTTPLNQYSGQAYKTSIDGSSYHNANNIHGLQILAHKLGYQVKSEPNDFNAPTLKVKKNTDISEEEELFEFLLGHEDLVENGQWYLEFGIPHPKYGYLFQDQKGRPKESDMLKLEELYAANYLEEDKDEENNDADNSNEYY